MRSVALVLGGTAGLVLIPVLSIFAVVLIMPVAALLLLLALIFVLAGAGAGLGLVGRL
jgi:hypothetical protein